MTKFGDGSIGLEIKEVNVCFGGIHALSRLTMEIPNNKLCAIIGPNGAGKSTLVDVLTGFRSPASGSVMLFGEPLVDSRGLPPHKIARAGILRTFQKPRLLGGLSVLENVMLADVPTASGAAFMLGRKSMKETKSESAIVRRSWAALEQFNLVDVAHQRGEQISGGQARLLELARMSLRAPKYLFLDEPAAGVAPSMRQTMVDHLHKLRKLTGAAIVVVEHDMAVVEALADEVFVMADGSLLARGSMRSIRNNPEVVDAYLGAEVPRRVARGDAHGC